MDIPRPQKPLLEFLLNPHLLETQWLRWMAGIFIFYFIFANGISISNTISHSFIEQLSRQDTDLDNIIFNWLLYGILSEFILIVSLIFGLAIAYGVVRIKTAWFRWMAIACFIVAGCRIAVPIISLFYSLFLQNHTINIPTTALIYNLFWVVIGASFASLLPLYIGLILRVKIKSSPLK